MHFWMFFQYIYLEKIWPWYIIFLHSFYFFVVICIFHLMVWAVYIRKLLKNVFFIATNRGKQTTVLQLHLL